MGQVIRNDKITALSQGGGNISLASGASLTIGGQQYVTTTQLSVALPTLAAASLYFVYAVQTAGVVALNISQNVNSVGPTGFLSWKLVGAFYSNGNSSVGFGSFVNIEGSPESESITCNALVIGASFGTVTSPAVYFRRKGDKLEVWGTATSGTMNSTSGPYVQTPGTLAVDFNKIAANVRVGIIQMMEPTGVNTQIPNVNYGPAALWVDGSITTQVFASNHIQNNTFDKFINSSGNVSKFTFQYEVPISGWTTTPLRNL